MPYTRKGVVYEGPTLKRGRKAKKVVAVVAAAPKAKVSKTVKNAINKAISRNLETKCAVYQVWQQQPVGGAGLDPGSGLGLTTTGLSGAPSTIMPTIPAGSGDANRQGDIVMAKRCVLKYSIRALDTTGNTAGTNPFRGKPFQVRVIVFNHRYANDDYSPTGIIDKGNTTGNIDALPDSWLEPYNRKEFKILYSKTFKMCALSDTGTTPPTIENSPSQFLNFVAKRVSIKIPKRLLFNGNAASSATNFQPKMSICVANLDGTSISNIQFRAQFNAECQVYYTDA